MYGGRDGETGSWSRVLTRIVDIYIYFFLFFDRYLLEAGANVHAHTQTNDTALTYACENGHTDVADLLLQYGAHLVS